MGTPHETEFYVSLQRVDVMFSIVYPDGDNKLRPVQERHILYLVLLITKDLGEVKSP